MRAAAFFQHQENQNTNGGAATSGSWEDRKITNIVSDLNGLLSLNALTGIITIQPGIYIFEADTPFFFTNKSQSRLVNAGTGAVILLGTTVDAISGGSTAMAVSKIKGILQITTITTIKLQSQVEVSNATGYGYASNFAMELYTTGNISVLG